MKNNQRNANINTFTKHKKSAAMMIYDDKDIALWQRVFNFILLEVEFDEGYINATYVKQLSEYFKTDKRNIHAAIKKLIEKTWLLKYPYGSKRAKGYIINPEHFWVGSEESEHQKIKIYRNTMNKLLVEIDSTDNESVEVKIIDHKLNEDVNTKWNKNYNKLKDLAA